MVKYIISALLFILPIVGTNNCVASQRYKSIYRHEISLDKQNDDAIAMLRQFYEEYAAARLQDNKEGWEMAKAIERKYVDSSLIKYMIKNGEEMGLDYDPYLYAQDFDEKILQFMRIEPCGENLYRISLWNHYIEAYNHIKVRVKKCKVTYKIVDITLPNHYL